MRYLIYTLYQSGRMKWLANRGVRTTEGIKTHDRMLGGPQTFESKDAADGWLLQEAHALNVPSLPKTIVPTAVPLPLGGVIPGQQP
jgi:hypothetical protein